MNGGLQGYRPPHFRPPPLSPRSLRHPSHPSPRRLRVVTPAAVPPRAIMRREVRPAVPPLDHMIKDQPILRPAHAAPQPALPPHRLGPMSRPVRPPLCRLVEPLRLLRQSPHPDRRAADASRQPSDRRHRTGPRQVLGRGTRKRAARGNRGKAPSALSRPARTHALRLSPTYRAKGGAANNDILGAQNPPP